MPPGSSDTGGDVLTGREAAVLRRTISVIIDDELSRRQVLPEGRIREIAKEVAQQVYAELAKGLETKVRDFFTEEGIEEIIYRVLKSIGLRADGDHADATREIVDAIFRGYRRRSEYGADFVKETIKALALLFAGAILAYLGVKGVPH